MTKWLLLAYTDCADKSKDDKFNEWYDKIHLPDIVKLPGFVSATRCVNTNPAAKKNKFIAIYEVESEDIQKSLKMLKDYGAQLKKQGRLTDLLLIGPISVYRQLSSMKSEPFISD